MEDPKQERKADLAHILSYMDPTRSGDHTEQIPSDDEDSENGINAYGSDIWEKRSDPSSPGSPNTAQRLQEGAKPAIPMNLQELASQAFSQTLARTDPAQPPPEMGREPPGEGHKLSLAVREALPRRDGPTLPPAPLRAINLPPRDFYPAPEHFSPRQPGGPPVPLTSPGSLSARSPTNSLPASESELPPLNSPSHGVNWLPSVKELMISEPRPPTPGRDDQPPHPFHSATFPHSLPAPGPGHPPVPPLRPSSISGPYGTSPISQDGVHPDLPSPRRPSGMGYFYPSPNTSSDGANLHRLSTDYGSNGPESPDGASGLGAESAGGANDGTSEGTYKCTFEGCQARPFQTQYLLNSHANVHSLERPHYCPVLGCPRSKAGQGFKRKNEMIRHGFVHKSPGYACPFCPDREHKYPRPDNLQR